MTVKMDPYTLQHYWPKIMVVIFVLSLFGGRASTAVDITVVVADDDFDQYTLHKTRLPRPDADTAGVEPVVWVVEQSGAAQLQLHFFESSQRLMTNIDNAAWAAARSIGKTVTRTKGQVPGFIRECILSDKLTLAGFKSTKMTFRRRNYQLRQPTALVHPHSMAALDGRTFPGRRILATYNQPDTPEPHALELKCGAIQHNWSPT